MENNNFDENKYGKILEGHESDGIQELDNRMPFWLTFIFIITFVFSVAYLVLYTLPGATTQEDEFAKESAAYDAKYKSNTNSTENFLVLLNDETSINSGKEIYTKNCIACHGALGEGNAVGPNLTDNYWINGGSFESIYNVIKNGKNNTAMMAWGTQISPKDIQLVSSFVESLKGTNPPGAKEVQGELYQE